MREELPYLTSVRGLAALAVLAYHCSLLPSGEKGVDAFFLLSGFILTWGHLRRPRTAAAFWRARLVRTTPTHLVATSVVGAVVICGGHDTIWRLAQDLALLPILSYPVVIESINPPTWSLAVEWVAYLAFPLLVGGVRRAPRAALATFVVMLVARATFLNAFGWTPAELLRGVSEFGLGMVVASLGWEPRPVRWLAWLDSAPLRFLGDISYPLYLIQGLPLILIYGGFQAVKIGAGPATHIIFIFSSLALAIALHFLVERPAQRWLRRPLRTGKKPDEVSPVPTLGTAAVQQ